MNGSSIQPERAWQMALDQLRLDMPKASFDTWVRDTRFVSFEDGVFTIGTPNAYGREWLAEPPDQYPHAPDDRHPEPAGDSGVCRRRM